MNEKQKDIEIKKDKTNKEIIDKRITNKQLIIKIIKITLVILWMILVFSFSSEVGDDSTNTSGATITKILTLFKRDWNIEELNRWVEILQPFARKTAHFTLYALGGVLIYNLKIDKNTKKNILISILFGCAYSISDEIHQMFVPGRTGLIMDVFIDTFGVTTGCFCHIFLSKIVENIKKSTFLHKIAKKCCKVT